MEMKLASVSVATAFANMVLPVPGSPTSSIPFTGLIPIRMNTSGFLSGSSTASLSSFFTLSSPPMSAPVNIWPFYEHLAQGAWPHLAQRVEEVLARDLQVVQYFGRDEFLRKVYLGQYAAQHLHCRLLGERGDVSAGVAVRYVGKLVNAHVLRKRHGARVNLQYFLPSLPVRHAKLHFPVEPSGPAQRRVDASSACSWRR